MKSKSIMIQIFSLRNDIPVAIAKVVRRWLLSSSVAFLCGAIGLAYGASLHLSPAIDSFKLPIYVAGGSMLAFGGVGLFSAIAFGRGYAIGRALTEGLAWLGLALFVIFTGGALVFALVAPKDASWNSQGNIVVMLLVAAIVLAGPLIAGVADIRTLRSRDAHAFASK